MTITRAARIALWGAAATFLTGIAIFGVAVIMGQAQGPFFRVPTYIMDTAVTGIALIFISVIVGIVGAVLKVFQATSRP